MVKVIKDNYRRKCICEHCKSILEYELHDIVRTEMSTNEYVSEIKCPACLHMTTIYNDSI